MRHVSIKLSDGEYLSHRVLTGRGDRLSTLSDSVEDLTQTPPSKPQANLKKYESATGIGASLCACLGAGLAIGVAGLIVTDRLDSQIAEESYHYDAKELAQIGNPSGHRARTQRVMPYLIEAGNAQAFPVSHKDNQHANSLVSAHHCLTEALYYEARGESLAGRLAVGEVIGNRVRHRRFPDTVCGVVYQGSGRQTGCQFSFTCDGSMLHSPNPKIWRRARNEAAHLMLGLHRPVTNGAIHYHADYVAPNWAKDMLLTSRIGSHLFYRSKRDLRVEPRSFHKAGSGQVMTDWMQDTG